MSTTTPIIKIDHFIDGKFVPDESPSFLPVLNPATHDVIAHVPAAASSTTVDTAVAAASRAFLPWSTQRTIQSRAALMMKFHGLVQDHSEELADCIVQENGKNKTEALADIAKGLETVAYACSLPVAAVGEYLRVSSAVVCQDKRVPLGVVVSIVPFNFPFMVPMWTVPIALVMGNTVVLKPSEKVPLTMHRVAALMNQAGVPPGCFNMVHGGKETVDRLLASPTVQAVTFVGSSPVAKLIAETCHGMHKRCTALGGAKNHLVVVFENDNNSWFEEAAHDIVVSFCGCAGQRCMAASVLLLVGGSESVRAQFLKIVQEKAAALQPGTQPGQVGPVIDQASFDRIQTLLSNTDGTLLLDGRLWSTRQEKGCWIGPTMVLHTNTKDDVFQKEVFGPVLSVYHCTSWQEAIEIENASPFGNAAAVYTQNGAVADWFTARFRAAMLGVNIGIPVPREPFSFGGLYGTMSKYGDMDITGDGAVEFFSNRIKVSTKWPSAAAIVAPSTTTDKANFAGSM